MLGLIVEYLFSGIVLEVSLHMRIHSLWHIMDISKAFAEPDDLDVCSHIYCSLHISVDSFLCDKDIADDYILVTWKQSLDELPIAPICSSWSFCLVEDIFPILHKVHVILEMKPAFFCKLLCICRLPTSRKASQDLHFHVSSLISIYLVEYPAKGYEHYGWKRLS